jgi:hypothetical protein
LYFMKALILAMYISDCYIYKIIRLDPPNYFIKILYCTSIRFLYVTNTHFKRLSFIVVIAATLLSVAVVTSLSMVEEADANHRKSSSSTSTSQSITQSNTGSGNSRNFNSATNSGGSSSTTCINGVCTTTTR